MLLVRERKNFRTTWYWGFTF